MPTNKPIPMKKPATSYREVQMGNTLYRVTSEYLGNIHLQTALEDLAMEKALRQLSVAENPEHLQVA